LVKQAKFKGNGRLFYPSQQFYEHYSNTTRYGNEESDFIERKFSDKDEKVSKIITKIKAGGGNNLTTDEIMLLQYFVNIMYWRIPSNTNKVKNYISKATDLSAFRMIIKDTITNERVSEQDEKSVLQKMKADTEFYKYIKLLLPAVTFPEIFNKPHKDFAHIFPFPFSDRLPKLVSDNPIIYRRPGAESLHTDEFIFPLTHSDYLFRHRLNGLTIHSVVRILIDMLLLLQAYEYVSVTEIKYPSMLIEQYNKQFRSIEHLRETLFSLIFQRKDNG
jgi:hypothetical protein